MAQGSSLTLFRLPEKSASVSAVWAVAKTLPITFNEGTFTLPSSPYEVEAYELSVPFDRAQDWMDTLETRHVRYEAVVNAALPMVDFYLPNLSERNAAALQQTFGNQMIDIDQLPDDLRVVPPADLTWAQWEGDTGKAALASIALVRKLRTEQTAETFNLDRLSDSPLPNYVWRRLDADDGAGDRAASGV